MIEELREIAKCKECKRDEYCKRLQYNKLIKLSIVKEKKCPDFEGEIIK